MGSNPEGNVTSIWSILSNLDWLTNWLTAMAFASAFSLAASTVKDKLTFAAIMLSMFVSALLAAALWPIMLVTYSGGLVATMVLAIFCGLGGFALLLTLIGVIRKYIRDNGKGLIERALPAAKE